MQRPWRARGDYRAWHVTLDAGPRRRFDAAHAIDPPDLAQHALDDAGDEFADAVLVGVDHQRALGLAHALHDHLLGSLRGNAPEVRVLDRFLDERADFDIGHVLDRIHQAQLAVGRFHHHVVGDDFPAPERLVVAAVAVDRHAHRDVLLGIALLGGRRERGLHRFEDDGLRHARGHQARARSRRLSRAEQAVRYSWHRTAAAGGARIASRRVHSSALARRMSTGRRKIPRILSEVPTRRERTTVDRADFLN